MSDTTAVPATRAADDSSPPQSEPGPPRHRRRAAGALESRITGVLGVVLLVLAVVLPLYLDQALLVTGLAVMAAAVGAIGLNLLTGSTGQLSLAHAFFIAIGTYGYAYFSGAPGGLATPYGGLELPPLLGAALAVVLAGLAGLAFSPISGRLSGIYLGIASLSLVIIGQHLLFNWDSVTGGPNGRSVPAFSLFGFEFANTQPDGTQLFVLNVPFRRNELLWYLFLAVLVLGFLFARNLMRGRSGRALQMIRDKQTAAAVMGVNVARYKSLAFVVSSMYAGAAGVLLAQVLRNPTPGSFGLTLSITYLAMIVIGGLGSVAGSVVGATFVAATPLLLNRYADLLPFLARPGSGGVDSGTLAKFLYGGAVVLVLLLEPGGLAAIGRRVLARATGSAEEQRQRALAAAGDATTDEESVGSSGPPAASAATGTAATSVQQGPDRGADPSTEGNQRP